MSTMNNLSKILAKNMKLLRFNKNWNQSQLAEASGYSVENIKKLETGATWISASGVTQLAKAFNVEEDMLFFDNEKTQKPNLKDAFEVISNALSVFNNIPNNYLKILEELDWDNPNIEVMLSAMSNGFKKKASSGKAV